MLDFKLFVSTYLVIFIAELPDKTAVATVFLASRKNPSAVFIGVALAFVVQTVFAIIFGNLLHLIPAGALKIVIGLLFLGFAFFMWLEVEAKEEEPCDGQKLKQVTQRSFFKTASSAFTVIFIAEWGDLTQMATAALQARYRETATIFVAAVLALWTVTAIAVFIGSKAKTLINIQILQKTAAAIFTLFGLYFLYDGVEKLI